MVEREREREEREREYLFEIFYLIAKIKSLYEEFSWFSDEGNTGIEKNIKEDNSVRTVEP